MGKLSDGRMSMELDDGTTRFVWPGWQSSPDYGNKTETYFKKEYQNRYIDDDVNPSEAEFNATSLCDMFQKFLHNETEKAKREEWDRLTSEFRKKVEKAQARKR